MPVVDVDPDELRTLTNHDEKSDVELREDLFNLGLEYEGETADGDFQLEFAPDRLDRLSVEGVARSLRYQYGDDRGVYVPTTTDADWTIEVDGTPPERPYVTGAVVRGLDMSAEALDSLIQLQEKLHATMGRTRAKGAIGVHDLTMLKGRAARSAAEWSSGEGSDPRDEPAAGDDGDGPASKSIRYTSVDPDGETFVPLEGDREMTPAEVVDDHHIGTEYADLVAEMDRVPAIYDDIGLFSFPPVINGKRTEVTENSRDLFIEMTGTDQWTIDHMLSIVCYALDARGGTIEAVEVSYADDAPGEYSGRSFVRPDFGTKTKTVAHDRIETVLGVELDERDVADLAERSGLGVSRANPDAEEADAYEFEIPPYRVDVLHPIDVIDDLGRAYGFNTLEPRYPDVSTVGGRHDRSKLERATRDVLVGLGFEDLLNFYMISEEHNYERLGVRQGSDVVGGGDPVTIQEPYSEDYTMLRSWALPSLMLVLENNTHRSYPQDLAEIGLAAEVDESTNTNVAEHRTVAAAVARHDATYEDAKARLQAIAANFDKELTTPPTEHPTFIDGRTAAVELDGETVGVIGEVHPEVLVEHDLEVPVAAFEFRLDALE